MPAGQFERIQPSPRYDGTAGALLGRAYARPKLWQVQLIRRPSPGPRTAAWLRSQGIVLDIVDDGGLTGWQRAFQRSLYWCHNGGGNGRRNPVWMLQVQWAPAPSIGGHEIAIRVHPASEAESYYRRLPRSQRWAANPDLRSGGAGSGRERFS